MASAELYHPTAGPFTSAGSLNAARDDHTATLVDNGTVVIAGGGATSALASAEVYDPASGIFAPTGSMTSARYNHTATLLNNARVLVAGGLNVGSDLASAEEY